MHTTVHSRCLLTLILLLGITTACGNNDTASVNNIPTPDTTPDLISDEEPDADSSVDQRSDTSSELCAQDQSVQSNTCVACPVGSTNAEGDDASGSDTQCDATLCAQNERVQDNACAACPAGSINAAGDDATNANTTCDATFCQENQFVQSNTCVACPAGATNAAGDDASGADTPCDANACTQNQSVQNNTCAACPVGSTNEAGDDPTGVDTTCEAILCDQDERVASNTCVMCLAGSTNALGDDASGSNTQCDATLCAQDENVQDNACVACPAGSTNAAGDDASSSNTQCDAILCGENERVASNTCVACLAGTTNAAGDNSSGADTPCDASLCSENQQVQNNACVMCQVGATNMAGDDPTGANTTCDVALCAQDERVTNNVCVPCLAGSINAAGDDPTGADTMCGAILCDQDERVQSNACVACAPGSTNALGDDASGSDTRCDVTFCAQDERVQGNACVACAPGSTNTSGDDASALDTQCDATLCGEDEFVENNTCAACQGWATNVAGDDASGSDSACDDPCMGILGVVCTVVEQAYIKASNTDAADQFGWNIALSGDTLAVSSIYEASNSTGINNNQNNNSAQLAGAVYVFVRTNGTWVQQAYLKASNNEAFDSFGSSLAIDGDTIVVGATSEDSNATGVNGNQANNSAGNSGAAYVFTRTNNIWAQQAYLKASNTQTSDSFGSSLAIDGDTIVVGATSEDSNATGVNGSQADNAALTSGAVYVFTRTNNAWAQQAYIKASNTDVNDSFGFRVALNEDTLAVSTQNESSNATGINGNQANNDAVSSGAVYVFTRTNTTWTQQAYIKASNAEARDLFGSSVALDEDTLVVGAQSESSNSTGVNGDETNNTVSVSGAAYVFTRTNGAWSQQAYIKASNTGVDDRFGFGVDIDGDLLAVGAYGEASGLRGDQANNSEPQSGAAYMFTRTNGIWSQQDYLKAPTVNGMDYFGRSVALDGRLLVVNAQGEDSNARGINGDQSNDAAPQSGAVYTFGIAP